MEYSVGGKLSTIAGPARKGLWEVVMDVACSVCGGRNTDFFLSLKGSGRVWKIHNCGYCHTQFIYPPPTVEELKSLYNRHFETSGLEWKRLANPNYGRLSFPRQWGIIKGLVGKKEGKILDFGCGGGHFLDRVSDGWDKWGIEISEVAADVAVRKGVKVVETIGELQNYDVLFDVIVMFAAIEHLPNPREAVSQLSELLKVGGLFVVMTGDVGSIKAKLQGERWHLYTPPGHIYFFTAHSVDYLMGSLGLKKVKSLYTDGGVTSIPFMPLNILLRMGLEVYHRIPLLNTLPLFDTYYGYYRKEEQ